MIGLLSKFANRNIHFVFLLHLQTFFQCSNHSSVALDFTCSFFQYFDFFKSLMFWCYASSLHICVWVCMCVRERDFMWTASFNCLIHYQSKFSIKCLLNHVCLIMPVSNFHNHQCGLSLKSPRGKEWSFQPCPPTTLTSTESNLRIRGLKGLNWTMTRDTGCHSLLGAQDPRTAQVVQLYPQKTS